jgi:hypothetical protein
VSDSTTIVTDISNWYNIGMAIGAFSLGIAGFFIGRNKKNDDEKHDASINQLFQVKQNIINDKLVAYRVLMNADRAKIGQFHNGGKFLDGSPMKRFSITHESCDSGVPFQGAHLQNIVVTILWDLILSMKKNDGAIVFTKDLPEGNFRSYYKSHGIDAFAILPVRKDELFTGFVMVEWCDIDKVPQDLAEAKAIAEEYRSAIEVEMLLRR